MILSHLFLALLFVLPTSVASHKQSEKAILGGDGHVCLSYDSLAIGQRLFRAIRERDDEEKVALMDTLLMLDGLSFAQMNDIGSYLVSLEEYELVEQFYENWTECHPKDGEILGIALSFSYFHSFDGRYYQLDCCARSNDAYEEFLEERFVIDDVSWESLNNYGCVVEFAQTAYFFAWNALLRGDEERGMNLLWLAKSMGDERASYDYYTLQDCSTILESGRYKAREEREFDEWIRLFDRERDFIPDDSLSFWQAVNTDNPECRRYQEEIHKKKIQKPLRRALAKYENMMDSEDEYKELLNPHLIYQIEDRNPYSISQAEERILNYLYDYDKEIHSLSVFQNNQKNAFCTINGDIYITSALLSAYNYNEFLMLGSCAHEAAHHFNEHILMGLWKQALRERRNNTWAMVLAGTYAAFTLGVAITSIAQGFEMSDNFYQGAGDNIRTIGQIYDANSYYYYFQYSQQLEIEADITAYRFLESHGYGGYSYIMALQILESGIKYGKRRERKTNDHPEMRYRIRLLKYLHRKECESAPSVDESLCEVNETN